MIWLKQSGWSKCQLGQCQMLVMSGSDTGICAEVYVDTLLENLHDLLPEASPEQNSQFCKIIDLVEKLGVMARNISYDLRPSLLDDFGLVATIEASVAEFMARQRAATINLCDPVEEVFLHDSVHLGVSKCLAG